MFNREMKNLYKMAKQNKDELSVEIAEKDITIPKDLARGFGMSQATKTQKEKTLFKIPSLEKKNKKKSGASPSGGGLYLDSFDEDEDFEFELDSVKTLREINLLLKLQIGRPFNTSVLRIALDKQEDTIASVITAYYEVKIDEYMIDVAVDTNMFQFLYAVWAYNKNFVVKASATETGNT